MQRNDSQSSNKRPKCDTTNSHSEDMNHPKSCQNDNDCSKDVVSQQQFGQSHISQSNRTPGFDPDNIQDRTKSQSNKMNDNPIPMNESEHDESENSHTNLDSDSERDADYEFDIYSNMEPIKRAVAEDNSANSQSSQDSEMDTCDDDQSKVHPYLPISMKDLAGFIKSDDCQSIVILAGAGMSRSSGSKFKLIERYPN